MTPPPHRFCIAPMMDWTDRHCRFFHRQLTRHALLYTEMITAPAIVHGDRQRLLGFDPAEHPVALQIGGSDPALLAEATRIGSDFGYDEINLNVGCPSSRVQEGRFGACLMLEPGLVARCYEAMARASSGRVTIKCRIGVDEQDTETGLDTFIDEVASAGARTFIVHARKALLKGLSPKENREIPPLDHDRVRRLKQRRPELTIVLNGGLADLDTAQTHLAWADGIMLGRAAYQQPYLLAAVDRQLFADSRPDLGRADIAPALIAYAERHLVAGGRLSNIARHILGLYHAQPGGRAFRRHLSERSVREGADGTVLADAFAIAEAARAHARAVAA